jgi:hypothetical protein
LRVGPLTVARAEVFAEGAADFLPRFALPVPFGVVLRAGMDGPLF